MKVYLTIESYYDNYYLTKNENIINYDYDEDEEYEDVQYSYCDEFELIFVSDEYADRTNYIIVKDCDDEYKYFKQKEYHNGTFVHFISADEFYKALSEDEKDEVAAYIVAEKLAK